MPPREIGLDRILAALEEQTRILKSIQNELQTLNSQQSSEARARHGELSGTFQHYIRPTSPDGSRYDPD